MPNRTGTCLLIRSLLRKNGEGLHSRQKLLESSRDVGTKRKLLAPPLCDQDNLDDYLSLRDQRLCPHEPSLLTHDSVLKEEVAPSKHQPLADQHIQQANLRTQSCLPPIMKLLKKPNIVSIKITNISHAKTPSSNSLYT